MSWKEDIVKTNVERSDEDVDAEDDNDDDGVNGQAWVP